jgi:hypothetical protein
MRPPTRAPGREAPETRITDAADVVNREMRLNPPNFAVYLLICAFVRIHAYAALHTETPLIPFLCLVHTVCS